jgi:phage terminase small subunit
MKPLTPMQKSLVDARLSGLGVSAAGKVAGYSDHSAASRALQHQHVQQAINKRVSSMLQNSSLDAARVIGNLVNTADSEKIKLDASKAVLDRTGHISPTDTPSQAIINVQINLDD